MADPVAMLARLRERLAKIEAEMSSPRFRSNGDPAVARLGVAALRQVHRSTDRDLARYAALSAEADQLRGSLSRYETQLANASRRQLTAEDVVGAVAVRDRHGWHRVVRCSARSVTVETGHSWTDRIPLDRILEVHHG